MRKRPRPDQIEAIVHQIQADLEAGLNVDQACRKGGIGLTTYYRWKARQENSASREQFRISELEDEVGRLKQLVKRPWTGIAQRRKSIRSGNR